MILIPLIVYQFNGKFPQPLTDKEKTGSNAKYTLPKQTGPSPTRDPVFSGSEQIPSGWQLGDNPVYSIAFPPDWKPAVRNVTGGGTSATFTQQSGEDFPRVIVEADQNPNDSIQKRIATIKNLPSINFSEATTDFQGIQASEVVEDLPITDAQKNPLHKTFLFFQKNGVTYVIAYAYFQNQDATQNQQKISQMINTFRFK